MDAFDMPAPPAPFEARGGWVVDRLCTDLALTPPQAAGIVGNLGYESDGFTKLQEVAPRTGRGGYGWAQWTGTRRDAYEKWCSEQKLDPTSDQANYGYLLVELRSSEAHALDRVRKTDTLEAATFTFGVDFERPAGTTATNLPANDQRIAWGRRALAGAKQGGTQPAPLPPAPAPPPPPSPEPIPENIARLARILIWISASHQPLDRETANALASLMIK
jgi:Phage tail lysozyme